MVLKDCIKINRQKLGLSQAELARLIDVAPSQISYWEAGKSRPLSPALIKLSKALDFKLDDTEEMEMTYEIQNRDKSDTPIDDLITGTRTTLCYLHEKLAGNGLIEGKLLDKTDNVLTSVMNSLQSLIIIDDLLKE